ncbi:MAG: hypothetical protein EBU66_16915 [Bacteroidetes bacterium]|nr:hypothetical protein [Bacteroidota bacterium]
MGNTNEKTSKQITEMESVPIQDTKMLIDIDSLEFGDELPEKEDCNEEIMALIKERLEIGRQNYGHGLIQNSKNKEKQYDWLKESLEEALDMSIYLCAKIIEIRNKNA